MPDRYLRDSICTSDNLNSLSALAEIMFYRLIISCDDFGRFDARPAVLKGKLFPLKKHSMEEIQSWLLELQDNDLIMLYESDGKPYLQMKTWEKYQRRRAQKSKFPDPPSNFADKFPQMSANACNCRQPSANDNNCGQLTSNAPEYEYECECDNRISNNEDTTTSTTDISSSLSPKENIDIHSKDSQKEQSSKVKDGMSRFTAQMEKPTTAAEYLTGMGIDLGDYFIAEQYRDFLDDGMEESAIMYAASLAKSINKVSWSYIKAILNRWMVNGIKTRVQAEEEEKQRGKESEANGNGRYSDHRRKNHEGPRTDYGLKPRFAGHRYDADGNDITGQDGT